jgi:hypothetical protein
LISAIKGRTTIELIRKENTPLGLTISGGIDKDGKPRVAQLKQGSFAQKADVLEIGDILLGINGIKTAGLKHEQVIDLIKQVGDQLTLDIEYDLPKWRMYNQNFLFFLSMKFLFVYNYIQPYMQLIQYIQKRFKFNWKKKDKVMVLFYVVELPMTRLKADHLLLQRYAHKDRLISKNLRFNK